MQRVLFSATVHSEFCTVQLDTATPDDVQAVQANVLANDYLLDVFLDGVPEGPLTDPVVEVI